MIIKRIKAVATGGVLLLMLFTAGCGGQGEEVALEGDATGQYATTELATESPIENSDDVSMETTIGETEGEETSKPVSEMTVAERIKTLTVEGCSLPLPCQVKDMGNGLSLGNGVTYPGTSDATCDLMYQGKDLGNVTLPDVSVATDHLVDMSTGYEDAWISALLMIMPDGDFEVSGVTPKSTREDIINLWGEADVKNERFLKFRDINEETGELIAYIVLSFDSNDLIQSILLEKIER